MPSSKRHAAAFTLVFLLCTVQVAAYCNGRDTVTEYDCLLLEHVLWQAPEHAPKIADWLLSQLAVDDCMKQVGRGSLLCLSLASFL